MLEETELVVQPGGDEGDEERAPVDQDGDPAGLQRDQLAEMIKRELREVVTVTHGDGADDGEEVEHDHERLGEGAVQLHELHIVLVKNVDGEDLPGGQPGQEAVTEG